MAGISFDIFNHEEKRVIKNGTKMYLLISTCEHLHCLEYNIRMKVSHYKHAHFWGHPCLLHVRDAASGFSHSIPCKNTFPTVLEFPSRMFRCVKSYLDFNSLLNITWYINLFGQLKIHTIFCHFSFYSSSPILLL